MARLTEEKIISHQAHWSFDPERANHKSLGAKRRLLEKIRESAVNLGMVYTTACLENPLRGSMKQETEKARRIDILNNL
jgi:hypothetical protein